MTENEKISEIIMSKMKEECVDVNIDYEWRKVVCLDDIGLIIRDVLKELDKEIQQYRALGTVEELREAREKQRARKPIRVDMCTCPNCGTYNETVKKRRNTVNQDIVYCWHCGQAMEVKRSKEE